MALGLGQWMGRGSSLFSGMLSSNETAVGLSIGSSSIKLVELKKQGKGWKLLHFGIVQLPEDVIVNREIANHIAVVESLKTLTSQIKLKSKSVCTSLTGTFLIVKRMQLDVPNPRELQDSVFWEAEQYVPFDVSDVVMDYQVLSHKDGKADVLLVAVKKSVLDGYMGCVDDAGLRPKIVDVDFFALQNLYETNYSPNPSEAVALVDLGAAATKLIVVHDGVPVFTKDSSIGGRNITAEIQKNMGLNYVDAETLKVGGQGTIPQEISELVRVMAENVATEIKRSIDFYSASSAGAPISAILLSGGTSKIPEFARLLQDFCGIPTAVINPFNAISYDPEVFTPDYIAAIAPIAAVPIGLALRAGTK